VALHRYGKFLVFCTFLLLLAGGMVTSTHSGLAVPDWPLSFGKFFPPMVGGVFYEHGHRMVAGSVALLTLGLALWAWFSAEGRLAKGLAVAALGAVVLQALLGGLTVIFKLPVAVSAGHAGLAQIFFCLVLSFTLVTSPAWKERQGARPLDPSLVFLAWATLVCVYGQILLGAVIRHEYVGLAIPDFPLSLGRLVPPLDDWMVDLNFAHRCLALAIFVLASLTVWRALSRSDGRSWISNPAKLLALAVLLQIFLGASTVLTRLHPLVATAHVAGGALVLGTTLILALRCGRAEGAAA
jgi:cytochrome c oxidase assembly protein subunit 15